MIDVSEKDAEEEEYQTKPNPESNQKNNPESDEEVHKAFRESIQEKSLLPILKQELRLKIQTRRLSEGQDELKSEIHEPKVYKLTKEEREKHKRRLEQNRKSLRRCRDKEFKHEMELKRTYDEETSKSESLKREKEELLVEKGHLMDRLQEQGFGFNENTSTLICVNCNKTISVNRR